MANRDTIVVGASAGGVQALSTLVAQLPSDLPAAVFIVLHISAHVPSLLPDILSRDSPLPVAHAVNGEEIKTGRIYVAPNEKIGKIAKLTCPDCHGALWEIRDEAMLRYRCHVGHAYSAESLSEGQSQMLEVALWSAVRALEEQIMLAKRIVERARKSNHCGSHSFMKGVPRKPKEHSSLLRKLLLSEKMI